MAETHKKPEMRGIMTYMRDKTHIVIWALVFSFVGFIIFSWGMDILGVSAPTNQSILAEVNGTEISYQDFTIRMGNQINLIRQQLGTSPDVQYIRLLQDQVFNDMVNEILIGNAIEEMGLFATNEEIIQEVRMRPRSEFLNRPELRNEDGAFDVGKYNIFLSQLSTNDYILLEADARIQIPQRKLQDLLTSTIRITEEEIKQAYLHQEQHVEVEYILAESNLFADATINITDREIEDYYQAHQENYFEEETRQLRYIIFYLNPTSSDSAAIDLQIDEALLKANNQEDFTDLAQEYSGADGDLGMFGKGTMIAEVDNAVFSDGTEEGDILGPIDSPLGKHIIKIEKLVKSNGSIDSVHAKHILFTYTYSAATEDMVETTARDFEFRAKDEGYDKVASELGFTILQTIPFRRFGFIPGFGVIPEVEDFAFESEYDINFPPVSDVIETPLGYVVFQLSNVVEERTKSLDDANVRFDIRQILIEQQQIQMAQNLMARLKTEIDSGTLFEDAAENEGIEVVAPASFKIHDYISEVGSDIIFSAAAFALDPGNVSTPVTANNGVYLIKLITKEPFDEESYNESKITISNDLLLQKRSSAFSLWLLSLREMADIEDYRDRFFIR